MMTVKICDCGGYVVGDGDLPKGFSPDDFLKAFGRKIMEKKAQGLKQFFVSEEEFNAVLNGINEENDRLIDEAPVIKFRGTKALTDGRLLASV